MVFVRGNGGPGINYCLSIWLWELVPGPQALSFLVRHQQSVTCSQSMPGSTLHHKRVPKCIPRRILANGCERYVRTAAIRGQQERRPWWLVVRSNGTNLKCRTFQNNYIYIYIPKCTWKNLTNYRIQKFHQTAVWRHWLSSLQKQCAAKGGWSPISNEPMKVHNDPKHPFHLSHESTWQCDLHRIPHQAPTVFTQQFATMLVSRQEIQRAKWVSLLRLVLPNLLVHVAVKAIQPSKVSEQSFG